VRALRPWLLALGLAGAFGALVLGGCAGRRIREGVYHSDKGYRVRIPGADWMVVDQSKADLELRHRDSAAGMVVNAVCDGKVSRRSPGVLRSHLLAGLRERKMIEQREVALDGRPGTRTVLEAHTVGQGARFLIDAVTITDARCVYDLIYAAPVDAPAEHHTAFDQFVGSFAME
jgi:hypothetical protein